MLRLLTRFEIAHSFTTHALHARAYRDRPADTLTREAHDVFAGEMENRRFEGAQAGLAWGALPQDDQDMQAVALRLAARSQPVDPPPSLRAPAACQGPGVELDT
eukprot:4033353-Alexandrium_andersonii.AAC.1